MVPERAEQSNKHPPRLLHFSDTSEEASLPLLLATMLGSQDVQNPGAVEAVHQATKRMLALHGSLCVTTYPTEREEQQLQHTSQLLCVIKVVRFDVVYDAVCRQVLH